MTSKEYQYGRHEKAERRWFAVLAKRREGMKWKDIADHFKCDVGFAYRMARKAENLERKMRDLPEITPRSGKKERLFVICENKRFHCIDRIYCDRIKPTECECGSQRFPIDSERGKELKELRAKCRTAIAAGYTRSHDKPSLCSKFSEAVIMDNMTSRMLNL